MIRLKLNANEATVLHIILERISGHDYTGRQHAYSLLRKLEEAGEVYSSEKEAFFPVNDKYNNIRFV